MTLKETHRNAREAIWRSLDTFRGKSAIGRDSVHIVVIMLLYSKYLYFVDYSIFLFQVVPNMSI